MGATQRQAVAENATRIRNQVSRTACPGSILKREDDLVFTHHAKLFAHQLAGKIRIGGFGIEQHHAVAQGITLEGELRNFRFARFKRFGIFAPRKQTGRASDSKTGQQQQRTKRKEALTFLRTVSRGSLQASAIDSALSSVV